MHVNFFNRIFRRKGFKLFTAITISLGAIFFLAAFITDRSEDKIFSKRVNIAMRAIGHELLLRAGDSTSVVLPVVERSKGLFVLRFENQFAFQPDTLVAIVQHFLVKTGLSEYTVTVHECHRPDIVYGFEISPPYNTIKPCGGRRQPKACYTIEIASADFPAPTIPYAPIAMIISGILLASAVSLIYKKLGTKKLKPPIASILYESQPVHTIGSFVFDRTNQSLRRDDETILLTDKECKILMLLDQNIGQLTLRDEIIQEVWTNEGVITGRSLDMFISKLRKKLSSDPNVRIVNIHGKGYKLEIVNHPVA